MALIILDGWGFSLEPDGNAILKAHTPNLDRFYRNNPWTLLNAAGEAVGLPPGQMGNSEVGHLNIGAGRIVYQELTRISHAIETGDFFSNTALRQAMAQAARQGSSLHLIGLVSDGGVHSHLDHLEALLEMARRENVKQTYIHAILDGRDTPPASARSYLEHLIQLGIRTHYGSIATICGRYYAMDRDRRWDRVEKAYRAYIFGEGEPANDPLTALDQAYSLGETDEFVRPAVIAGPAGTPQGVIKSEDSVIFFNFRPDRVRQISHALVDRVFPHFDRGVQPPRPFFVSLTEYEKNLPVEVAFPPDYLEWTLGETYSRQNLEQLRIAETEKYAHVTFFLNGGQEEPFPGEERVLIPSPKVTTYDLHPQMSAPGVARCVLDAVTGARFPLVVVNFANADMVGHTGDLKAAVEAVEAVDFSLGLIAAAALPRGWRVLICGDHGNAEQMLGESGGRHTAHTTNPVPCIILGAGSKNLRDNGILADVAPTILEMAGLPQPPAMTGRSILAEK
ncbi:MAG: 2,3-bisphosphoglycerate-independent phosphoglycerate mutase [Bacillota bacterium]